MAQLIDFIQLASTVHFYPYDVNGQNSIDGDFNTYLGHAGGDFASGSGGVFGSSVFVSSEHTFDSPKTLKQVSYKIYGSSQSSSSTDNHCNLQVRVQYKIQGDSTWYDLTDANIPYNNSSSNTTISYNPSLVTLSHTETILNVVAVRAFVTNSGSHHNSDGNHTWDLRLYELQAFGDGPAGFGYIL